MKLKLLITPILVVTIIIFFIWILIPAVLNVKADREDLASAESRLFDIQDKIAKTNVLEQQLQASSQQREALFEYLPEDKAEEGIINYFNNLSSAEGIAVYDISIAQKTKTPAYTGVSAADNLGTNSLVVDLKLAGQYGNIRTFLQKIASLKRYNTITEIKISKKSSNAEGNLPSSVSTGAGQNYLDAQVTIEFKYLEKLKALTDINDSIFSTGKFDMSVIDELQKSRLTSAPALTVDAAQRNNPFSP